MKKISAYIFENFHLTNWLMILVSFMGILGFLQMQKPNLPQKDDYISINLSWANTSISEMENGMILSLVEKLKKMEGITQVKSTIYEGGTRLCVRVSSRYSLKELQEQVRSTVETLPAYQDGTWKPLIHTGARIEEALL